MYVCIICICITKLNLRMAITNKKIWELQKKEKKQRQIIISTKEKLWWNKFDYLGIFFKK